MGVILNYRNIIKQRIEWKTKIDIENLLIKKAGGSQADAVNNVTTSKSIKTKHNMKGKKIDESNNDFYLPNMW